MTATHPEAVITDEQPTRRLSGAAAWIASALAFALGALSLYWTQYSIGTTTYRALFLGLVLALAFLLYPLTHRIGQRHRVSIVDLILTAISVAALFYLATHVEELKMRATRISMP